MSVACRPASGIPSQWLPIDRAASCGDSSRKARSCSPAGRSAGHRIPVAFAIRFPPRRITVCTSRATAMRDSVSVGKHVGSTTASPALVALRRPRRPFDVECVRTCSITRSIRVTTLYQTSTQMEQAGRLQVEFVVLARQGSSAASVLAWPLHPSFTPSSRSRKWQRVTRRGSQVSAHRGLLEGTLP